ncbi:hypothetical protein PISMIDRAFT_679292 [Pisolithus microcarpus 441]|uniref:Uncharacterized protein n=1 Tax=Pisolithus microcarpus 441 TaxID=765257 RepID=A0A0C9YFD1_9AGAM|nr:hypothetical protein PISMIDRAFT_679292 [Pisolithus microcarpus 441]
MSNFWRIVLDRSSSNPECGQMDRQNKIDTARSLEIRTLSPSFHLLNELDFV